MLNEAEIVNLQLDRQIKGLGKLSLELLEDSHKQIKTLEDLLLSMGITKYEQSNFNYLNDRKKILDRTMDTIRNLQSLINSFEIKLGKE